MHDLVGNSGMLRGWIAVWTMQMVWLFVALVIAVGATAILELMLTGRREPGVRQMPRTLPPLA